MHNELNREGSSVINKLKSISSRNVSIRENRNVDLKLCEQLGADTFLVPKYLATHG